jgi:hypothetical protein
VQTFSVLFHVNEIFISVYFLFIIYRAQCKSVGPRTIVPISSPHPYPHNSYNIYKYSSFHVYNFCSIFFSIILIIDVTRTHTHKKFSLLNRTNSQMTRKISFTKHKIHHISLICLRYNSSHCCCDDLCLLI